MQNSFVKMMSTISEIENHILKGLVLDEHGQWIPIADKKAVEEDFLAHLTAGQVLHEGRWVSIGEAKSAKAPTEIATTALEMPLTGTGENESRPVQPAPAAPTPVNPYNETSSGTPLPAADPSSRESMEFAPETKTIVFDVPPAAPSGPQATPAFDPDSGYAPETGAFVVESAEDQKPAGKEPAPLADDDVLSYTDRTTTSILLPTVTSWEQSARKRQRTILVYGTLGVALVGIGAIVLLIVQLVR